MKISIIGAGNVGASLAHELIMRDLCSEIVLIDIFEKLTRGKALDLSHAIASMGTSTKITPSKDFKDIQNSHIVVITAGSPRKEGMSRDDLLLKNAYITKGIAQNVAKYAPKSIIIEVANPLDAMSYVAYKYSGFDRTKVLGMAGILDSARMSYLISHELNVDIKDVNSLIIGSHGDFMTPLLNHCTVKDKLVQNLMSKEKLEQIIQNTKTAGANIVSLLGTSAYYAPASGAAKMCEAIVRDTNEMLPCSIMLEGEYGFSDVFNGVCVSLGKSGVSKIHEVELSSHEKEHFAKSVNATKALIQTLNSNSY